MPSKVRTFLASYLATARQSQSCEIKRYRVRYYIKEIYYTIAAYALNYLVWTSFSVGRQRKWRLPVVPVELEEWKFILVESVLHDKGAVQLAGAVYSLNDTRKVRSP